MSREASGRSGSPFAPHAPEETRAMLAAIGVDDVEELFDVPDAVRFDGEFGIEPRSERAVREEVGVTLDRNDDLVELLGRGHYDHYVPSLVDHLSLRSEFLTSYTQYQPEIAQGFLQALFEYQSLFVELTGLEIVNCSIYDAATALGEAATMAARVRASTGDRVLVPELLREERRAVLDNYVVGSDLAVETYPMDDGNVDVDALAGRIDDETVMVYAESPTVRGTIEERLEDVAALADDHDALFCLGTDPVALALLEVPADVGADVVVGDAGTLGLPASYGMGLGLFATREEYVRQVPGRLVGVSTDATDAGAETGDASTDTAATDGGAEAGSEGTVNAGGRRAYTLTLQTREQHIRRERATSNICTNQAWVALRTAIHAAWLGPSGLVELAETAVRQATALAARLDELPGVEAPVHDRHHFREFVARTDRPAEAVVEDLAERGYAVHAVGDREVQFCATDLDERTIDDVVAAVGEVTGV